MAVDTLGVVALGLEIAGCHPRNLAQSLQVILGDVVIVIMCAPGIGTRIRAIQKMDVAKFELLDALDVFVGYGFVKVVDSLAQTISIDPGGRLERC